MISRRRRSRGGYMIRVPANPTPPTVSVSNYVYSMLLRDSQYINQFNLTAHTNDLHTVSTTIKWSPIIYILQYIYEDELLKSMYFTNNAITFIAFTSPEASGSQSDNVEMIAQSVDISLIQNDDYCIMKHLTVDTVGGYTQVQTYLYPLPNDSNDKTILKSLTNVTLTYSNNESETSLYSQDMQYNTQINNHYCINIQVNQIMEEAFTKYCICYDDSIQKLYKFRRQIVKNIGEVNEEVLEEVTP